jgi:hypothetical protein
LQAEADAARLEQLRRSDLPRRHPLRLPLSERVVQVELAVPGHDALAGCDCDDRVRHAALPLEPLDHARDEVHVEAVGELAQAGRERPVDRLGGTEPLL